MTFRTDQEIAQLAERAATKLTGPRATFLRALTPLVGLEVSSPVYQAKIYRHDHPSRRNDLATKQSGCCLVWDYAAEEAGLDSADIRRGADIRSVTKGIGVMSLEGEIARLKGAKRTPNAKTREMPFEGDGVVMGGEAPGILWGKGGFSGSHMSCVVAVEAQASGDSYTVEAIDGGQPGVHGRTRAYVWCGPSGDELWAANLADDGSYVFDPVDMRPTKGRRVNYWIDLDALLS